MNSYLQHFINGRWVDSKGGARRIVVNPANEQPASEISLASREDVDDAVAAARAAFPAFSRTSPQDRAELLGRIASSYQERIADIAKAIGDEMGAPVDLASHVQVPVGALHFAQAKDALGKISFEEWIGDAKVTREPIGVVALITPWNWPLNQICAKVAAALAAGNTMILKPSEEAPGCAIILTEIMEKAGVPAGVFNLVNGDGAGAGSHLSSHPDIDMVSFTGSTRAGVAIAQAAAPSVKRVHQELGGKAPNLVLEGANLGTVLPPTLSGVLSNTGQSCIAPTRLLVHKSQVNDATRIVKTIIEQTKTGNPSEHGDHLGPVVNKTQYDKIQDLIQSAIDDGAELLAGGLGRPDGRNVGYYVKPTLFGGVTPEMRIFREEVFGPVATITSYETLDEGVDLANDTEYGLSATISGDAGAAAAVAPRIRAGLVAINSWLPDAAAPFGGYKRSGNGREFGVHGLLDFTETKTTLGAPVR